MSKARPAYRDLPGGDATGVFGVGDVVGCLNLLTPERVKAAASLVKTGQVFSLNGAIGEWPNPSPFGGVREAPKHVVLKYGPIVRDDYLDGFYPQCSSQWDHFLHCGDPRHNGFYNGMVEDAPGSGVSAWAERGIVGRGVLLDAARWREAQGRPIDWRKRETISAADLKACAKSQGVEITEGTIVLIRCGWETGYSKLNKEERVKMSTDVKVVGEQDVPGLEASKEVAELLWDWGLAAVAGNSPSMEAWPPPKVDLLHELVLCRLGMPFGEFWLVDALAAQCHAEKRYEFMLMSAPLNLPGGIGSTANVLAVL